jgi:hypothetical protein
MRVRIYAFCATAVLMAAGAPPALASFHVAHIHRVMTGLEGTTAIQYVEIEMDALGQNLVGGSKLAAFKADGEFGHIVLSVSTSVSSGNHRPWIMASDAFAEAAGISPDFTFDSTGAKGLFAEDGMVCWGKPSDQTDPDDYVDCVSYGSFTGPDNSHTSAPTSAPFGHGIVRVSKTGSSAADFQCEDPATPRNNVPETGELAATAACAQCGNDTVDAGESCDDGDTQFSQGDFCSADCERFACGVPSSVAAAVPKTSDALFVLRAAVASSNCDPRVCDANSSNSVTSSDALLILKRAVGQDVELVCPA